MTETTEVKLVLEKKGLNYKLKDHNIGENGEETFTFVDVLKQTLISGRVIRTFNEGEIYHWPLLNHENISPLIDVLYIRDDFHVCLTIDQEITLKDIVHDEDFVYDPRCFERKRSYARGVFSGLSYLHSKSLCLMNLSDANIVISKICDKAVITNFSCLVCAKKTNKSKMKVAEVYRAPESEKGDFEPIAAEIWASGILMLEMFLAHMVPWAVIDYKPKKILEIVNKLSLEFLQAANTGSVVSSLDLAKFKTFLKCFFKQNPVARITARYASIASFLRPKFQGGNLHLNFTDEEDMHVMDRQRNQVENTKMSTNVEIESQRVLSKEPCSWKRETENNYLNIPSPFLYESNDSLVAPKTADEYENTSKSCQTVETWINKDVESDYTCYQSKSLTFVKPKPKSSSIGDNDSNIQVSLNKICSFSRIETSPAEISDSFDLQNGDLSHLFDENILADELGGSKEKDLAPHMDSGLEATETRSAVKVSKYDCYKHSCFSRTDFCRMPVSRGLPIRRETSKLELQKIAKKIILLKKCQTSLQKQLKIFISEEFTYKQRKLLNQYEHMLHQEILRLRAELKRQCELDEQMEFNMCVNSKLRYTGGQNENLPLSQKSNSIFYEDVLDAQKLRDSMEDLRTAKNSRSDRFENKISPNIRLGKNYSYCRAIENSGNVWQVYEQAHEKKNQELASVELHDSTENLIESIPELNIKTAVVRGKVLKKSKISKSKPSRKTEVVAQEDIRDLKRTGRKKKGKNVQNDKDNKGKNQKKASKRIERQIVKKNENCKQASEFRRPFFFGLCPGGKIENSNPNLENLCETCKLTYNIM